MGKEPYVTNSSHHTQDICLCEYLWQKVLLSTKYEPDYAALHSGNLANGMGGERGQNQPLVLGDNSRSQVRKRRRIDLSQSLIHTHTRTCTHTHTHLSPVFVSASLHTH